MKPSLKIQLQIFACIYSSSHLMYKCSYRGPIHELGWVTMKTLCVLINFVTQLLSGLQQNFSCMEINAAFKTVWGQTQLFESKILRPVTPCYNPDITSYCYVLWNFQVVMMMAFNCVFTFQSLFKSRRLWNALASLALVNGHTVLLLKLVYSYRNSCFLICSPVQ